MSRSLLPSAAQRDKARLLLERALGPSKVLTSEDGCERFMRDESEAPGALPSAVVLAETREDIAQTLRVALEAEVPVTPRAAGTGRSGGAVPMQGGIVLATLGLGRILEIDRREGLAVVEPGVVLGDLHAAVEAEGWFYPPDPNSLKQCALGGNLAENSSGPRALKYGATRDYVLGIEAITMGGEHLQAGRSARKGVTGYDITSLLVGSEGTLAVFERATLKLIAKPEHVMTLVALFANVQQAAACVLELVGPALSPRCVELLDGPTLQALRAIGTSVAEAGALLLIEVDGSETSVETQAQRIGDICTAGGATSIEAAAHPAQRDRLWATRRELSYALRRCAQHKLAHDISVPRVAMRALFEHLAQYAERQAFQVLTYGHAGDGALHVNFLWNDDDTDHTTPRAAVAQAEAELFARVVELGGTLSAEHGIGLVKAPYLAIEQSAALIALQTGLKRVFDPKSLLNPGKIFTRSPTA
ncbi:MAG: D-lactate dehydrogenase [Pseudomonadota bacterium]